MPNWDLVCAILAELPETEQEPGGVIRVRGKRVAYLAGNGRSQPDEREGEEEFAVIRVGYGERAALVQQDPETFIVTPHYQNYPGVIVRLASVAPDQLRELLIDAWRLVAPKRLVRQFDGG